MVTSLCKYLFLTRQFKLISISKYMHEIVIIMYLYTFRYFITVSFFFSHFCLWFSFVRDTVSVRTLPFLNFVFYYLSILLPPYPPFPLANMYTVPDDCYETRHYLHAVHSFKSLIFIQNLGLILPLLPKKLQKHQSGPWRVPAILSPTCQSGLWGGGGGGGAHF
jgi:hypothetical protein